jgi:hypothetical protein
MLLYWTWWKRLCAYFFDLIISSLFLLISSFRDEAKDEADAGPRINMIPSFMILVLMRDYVGLISRNGPALDIRTLFSFVPELLTNTTLLSLLLSSLCSHSLRITLSLVFGKIRGTVTVRWMTWMNLALSGRDLNNTLEGYRKTRRQALAVKYFCGTGVLQYVSTYRCFNIYQLQYHGSIPTPAPSPIRRRGQSEDRA